MLRYLHIENIAVVKSADIELGSGFNVLTGETGAGKSILLGALSLIMGSKADASVVSDGADMGQRECPCYRRSARRRSRGCSKPSRPRKGCDIRAIFARFPLR